MSDKRGNKSKVENKLPEVHSDLHGLNMYVDAYGRLVSTLSIDQLKAFLDKRSKQEDMDKEGDKSK